MGQSTSAPAKYRFGTFELDREAAELRKRGIRIRLQDQPFRILCLLLDNRGDIVARENLYQALWQDGTFVEFDHSLNAVIAKIRQALGDSAENPRFVETVARRGYRFIAPVEFDSGTTTPAANSISPVTLRGNTQPRDRDRSPPRLILFAASAVAVLTFSFLAILFLRHNQPGDGPFTVMHRLTSDNGLTKDPVVSRDGTLLAYASDRDGNGDLNIWVQQLTGGTAIRLTSSGPDDHQPSFSPDGTKIVFRSERDGGGVYVVPSLGGQAILIAKDGRDPSFSPDGKWIAYWVGSVTYDALNAGDVFVVPASGGVPQRLQSNLQLGYPIWSPDSEHLLVLGMKAFSADGEFDWWVFARDGRSSTPTGAFQLLKQQGFPVFELMPGFPRVMEWERENLIFSARFGDSINVWKVRISPESWHVERPPQRLTSGHGIEDHPHLLPDGRVVFAGLARSSNLWSLTIQANEGKPLAETLNRLTDKASMEQFGSISGDGRYLVFVSTRSGQPEVWLKDLSTGQESRVGKADEKQERPEISPDGAMIAYSRHIGASVASRARPDASDPVCPECGWVWGWSPDNQTFLYKDLHPVSGIGLFDLKSGKRRAMLAGNKWPIHQARFSPDGKWIAFSAQINYSTSRLFVTPLQNGIAAPESHWIPLADASGWCGKPRWSPDASIIYFVSDRDGSRCLWAQHLVRDTKRPMGQPFSVMHFHSARQSMMNLGLGSLELDVTKDKLIFNLGELTGNIWLASTQ